MSGLREQAQKADGHISLIQAVYLSYYNDEGQVVGQRWNEYAWKKRNEMSDMVKKEWQG
jgi:hypothetical protein